MERKKGVLLFVLMLISALFFNFWITAGIFILAIFILPSFYSGLVILFIMDVVYSHQNFSFFPFYGMLSVLGILVYFSVFYLKRNLFFIKK